MRQRTGKYAVRTEPPEVEGEEFRPHPDFEWLRISDQGRVWSCRGHGRFLRPAPTRHGHLMLVPGRGNDRLVHRLVMEAFVGPRPDGLEVRHLNGDHLDNRLENLKYGTRRENIMDAIAHGTWASPKRKAAWKRNGQMFSERHREKSQRTEAL